MRIAALLTGFSGYQQVCYRELAELGNDLLIVHPAAVAHEPFEHSHISARVQQHPWETMPSRETVLRLVEDFAPDAIIMSSWNAKPYRAVMRRFRGRALRIMFSSNFWLGTPRQYVGLAVHSLYVNPLFECVWVPGERSELFARRIGFDGRDIIRGANCADVALYDHGPRAREEIVARRRFLFVGRLIEHKNPALLAEAYAAYRARVADPWDLSIAGTGPLASAFEGIPGVTLHGFMQPKQLADLMQEASCLVHPAQAEWYGVVLHEAAVAGLPLISSDGVGAVPHLLQDGFNGWVVEADHRDELVQAMVRMSELPAERLHAMSQGSRALGSRLTPEIWALNLHEEIQRRLPRVGADRRS